MTINPQIFTWLIAKISYIWSYLDSISIGNLFSLLDLGIAFVVMGVLLPSVLNIFHNILGSELGGSSRDFNKKGG